MMLLLFFVLLSYEFSLRWNEETPRLNWSEPSLNFRLNPSRTAPIAVRDVFGRVSTVIVRQMGSTWAHFSLKEALQVVLMNLSGAREQREERKERRDEVRVKNKRCEFPVRFHASKPVESPGGRQPVRRGRQATAQVAKRGALAGSRIRAHPDEPGVARSGASFRLKCATARSWGLTSVVGFSESTRSGCDRRSDRFAETDGGSRPGRFGNSHPRRARRRASRWPESWDGYRPLRFAGDR